MLFVTAIILTSFTIMAAQKKPAQNKSPDDIVQNAANKLTVKKTKLLANFDITDTYIYFENGDVAKFGITQQTCLDWEAVIEAKLKKAGFKIEAFVTPGLDIKLDVIKVSATELAYSIEMSLVQDMILERDKSVILSVPTWRKSSLGRVESSQTQKIKLVVLEMIDDFLIEYRNANLNK